jgi:hypothetical protein
LEKFYGLLLDKKSALLVGFCDQSRSLVGESQTLLYPFVCVLEGLVEYAIETEELSERIEAATKRIEKTFIKFAKAKGLEIAGAIIQDLVNKVGLRETFKIAREAHSIFLTILCD